MRTAKYFYLFLLALAILAIPSTTPAQISVGISVHIGPPALPVYVQPVCPGVGYMWTPGYWAYGPDGYYWVPGTWVMAPRVGLLWTPGYWGWGGGVYVWHGGYWGPHMGFYGGINYGFGYGGVGFVGGEWRGGAFHYNTAVTNVNTTVIHNTYINKTVINNNTIVNRTSYNGGTGGVTAQPTAAERAAEQEKHIPRRLCRRNTSKRHGVIRACWRPQIMGSLPWRPRRSPVCFMGRVSSRRVLPAGTPTRMRRTRTRTAHRARGQTTRRAQTRTSRIRRAGRIQIQTRPAAISRTRNFQHAEIEQ